MERKQILIVGGDNGGGSAGDQIMCEAACAFFVKNGYKVYTDAQSLHWKSPIEGVTTILQLRKDFYKTRFQRILKSILKLCRIIFFPIYCQSKKSYYLLFHGNEFKMYFQKSDVILFAGCGALTDKYPVTVLMWWAIIQAAKRSNKPIFISGVGIGPIKSRICKYFIRKIVNNVNFITVRDNNNSYRWIKQLSSMDNYDWVPDDACFYNGKDKYYIEPNFQGRIIGINIMKSVFPTDSVIKIFCENLLQIASLGDKFCLISVTHEDYEILVSMIPCLGKERCILVPQISPSATKHAISQLDLMISCRYHGCVFGVSQQVPTVGIYAEEYWKEKNEGVLSMFGCYESLFSISDIEDGAFREGVIRVLKEAEHLKSIMKKRKQELEAKAYLVHKKILELNYE